MTATSSRGGGVLVAVHNLLSSRQVFSAADSPDAGELDAIFVEISSNSFKMLLATAYVPPSTSEKPFKDFVNLLEFHLVDYAAENVIVCGDFNLSGIVWDDSNSFGAVQYVTPTVINNANHLHQVSVEMNWCQLFPLHASKGYTLDLLFASRDNCDHVTIDDFLVIGDPLHHECAFFKIKCLNESDSWHDSANKIFKNFYRANFEVINARLDLDWDSLFGDGDINYCLDKFYLVLNNIIEYDVPNQRCTPSTYPPWYTSELKNMISEKKILHSKWKAIMAIRLLNNNFSFADQEEISFKLQFRQVRSQCLRLSRRLYLEHIREVEGKIRHHVKSFWAYVNKFKKSNSLPEYMRLNDRSASSKRSICDLMADHFKSVFRTDTLEPVQRIESFNQLIVIQINFGELFLSLRKLDDNVKSGPDQIPPFFLRRCIPSLGKTDPTNV